MGTLNREQNLRDHSNTATAMDYERKKMANPRRHTRKEMEKLHLKFWNPSALSTLTGVHLGF
jgi:hypothetical protein